MDKSKFLFERIERVATIYSKVKPRILACDTTGVCESLTKKKKKISSKNVVSILLTRIPHPMEFLSISKTKNCPQRFGNIQDTQEQVITLLKIIPGDEIKNASCYDIASCVRS